MLHPKLLKLKPCRYDLQSCNLATVVLMPQHTFARGEIGSLPPQAIYEQEFELVDEAREGRHQASKRHDFELL